MLSINIKIIQVHIVTIGDSNRVQKVENGIQNTEQSLLEGFQVLL